MAQTRANGITQQTAELQIRKTMQEQGNQYAEEKEGRAAPHYSTALKLPEIPLNEIKLGGNLAQGKAGASYIKACKLQRPGDKEPINAEAQIFYLASVDEFRAAQSTTMIWLSRANESFVTVYGGGKWYNLDWISSLPGKDKNKAEEGKIYLSNDGTYIVRDPKGEIKEGKFESDMINKNYNSKDQLNDESLIRHILTITEKAKHTDSRPWIVTEQMYGSLEQVSEEYKTQKKTLSNLVKARIMYDVARGLQEMLNAAHSEDKNMYVDLYRDITLANILLPFGWEKMAEVKFSSLEELQKLPRLAKIGNKGLPTVNSKHVGGQLGSHISPEMREDYGNAAFSSEDNAWRFGAFAFELQLMTPLEKFTEKDRERMFEKRLKPVQSKEMEQLYNKKWMGVGPEVASRLLYDLVQLGCFSASDKRVSIDEIVKHLETIIQYELVKEANAKMTKDLEHERSQIPGYSATKGKQEGSEKALAIADNDVIQKALNFINRDTHRVFMGDKNIPMAYKGAAPGMEPIFPYEDRLGILGPYLNNHKIQTDCGYPPLKIESKDIEKAKGDGYITITLPTNETYKYKKAFTENYVNDPTITIPYVDLLAFSRLEDKLKLEEKLNAEAKATVKVEPEVKKEQVVQSQSHAAIMPLSPKQEVKAEQQQSVVASPLANQFGLFTKTDDKKTEITIPPPVQFYINGLQDLQKLTKKLLDPSIKNAETIQINGITLTRVEELMNKITPISNNLSPGDARELQITLSDRGVLSKEFGAGLDSIAQRIALR